MRIVGIDILAHHMPRDSSAEEASEYRGLCDLLRMAQFRAKEMIRSHGKESPEFVAADREWEAIIHRMKKLTGDTSM
jgi:hypothetical protein